MIIQIPIVHINADNSKGVSTIYKKVLFLFGIPLLTIVAVLFHFTGPYIAVAALFVCLLLCIATYRGSSRIMLRWYGCRELNSDEHAIEPILTELSKRFFIATPKAFTFDSTTPIIFTVGYGKRYSVVISKGALDIMDEDELRVLLACEAAKIASSSVQLNTFVAFLAGTIMSVSSIAMWIAILAGFGQEKDTAPRIAKFLAMGIVSLPAALLVHLFSVNSTLRSDAMATSVIDLEELKAAFSRMNNYIRLHCVQDFNPGHVHLFLLNPLRIKDHFDVYSSLFLIRPDFEQRMRMLKRNEEKRE